MRLRYASTVFKRVKRFVVERIIGLGDSPHRIAGGVALGWAVMWTPTVGIQIAIYVLCAKILRVNRSAGIPITFISNVFTAIPVYWFVWNVGAGILGTRAASGTEASFSGEMSGLLKLGLFESAFWIELWELLLVFGKELWVGAAVLGVFTAVPFYFLTLWTVLAYRAMQREFDAEEHERASAVPPEGDTRLGPEAEVSGEDMNRVDGAVPADDSAKDPVVRSI